MRRKKEGERGKERKAKTKRGRKGGRPAILSGHKIGGRGSRSRTRQGLSHSLIFIHSFIQHYLSLKEIYGNKVPALLDFFCLLDTHNLIIIIITVVIIIIAIIILQGYEE